MTSRAAEKITIRDVARAAGVSVGTASNVLTGRQEASTDLHERVLKAARDLAYKPNAIAASLRRKSTRTVGLVVPDITNSFFIEVVEALERSANEDGFELIMTTTREDAKRTVERIRTLLSRRVDGMIVIPTMESALAYAELRAADVPVVVLDRIEADNPFPSVAIENQAAARIGTEHLLALGHRRLALIINTDALTNGRDRIAGFRQAVAAAGVAEQCPVHLVGMSAEEAYAAVGRILDAPDRPTALFTVANLSTVGALRAIQQRGLRVPDDLSVLAFDDPDWLTLLRPYISAIRQPTKQLSLETWRLLKDRLREPHAPVRHIRLPTEIIMRESTAPPAATTAN